MLKIARVVTLFCLTAVFAFSSLGTSITKSELDSFYGSSPQWNPRYSYQEREQFRRMQRARARDEFVEHFPYKGMEDRKGIHSYDSVKPLLPGLQERNGKRSRAEKLAE